jgi:hypothetical protein
LVPDKLAIASSGPAFAFRHGWGVLRMHEVEGGQHRWVQLRSARGAQPQTMCYIHVHEHRRSGRASSKPEPVPSARGTRRTPSCHGSEQARCGTRAPAHNRTGFGSTDRRRARFGSKQTWAPRRSRHGRRPVFPEPRA